MSYTYEPRKHPHKTDKAPPPTATAYNSVDTTPQIPNRIMPETLSSFNLGEAMQARMTRTFGDLSAVKNYTPPAQTQEPVKTEGYSGSVTHAVSNATPSPSVAGAMQAKRAKKAEAEEKYGLKGPSKDDQVAAPARDVKIGDQNWTDVELVEQGQEEDLQRFHQARDFVQEQFYQHNLLKEVDPAKYRKGKTNYDQFIRDAAKGGPKKKLRQNVNSFLLRNRKRRNMLFKPLTDIKDAPGRTLFEDGADDTIRKAIEDVEEDDPYENREEKRQNIIKEHEKKPEEDRKDM